MRHINVGRPENQRRDHVIVAVLLIISWALASLDPSQTLGLTRVLRASVLAPFLAADAVYEERAGLARRADQLNSERDYLYRELQGAADLERENRDLRALMGVPDRQSGLFIIAELVPGRPAVGDSHSFLLRASSLSSLEAPAGVSVPAGLVGVLRSTGGRTGLGDFWTHPDFRVSVRSTIGNATGIVKAAEEEEGTVLMLVEGVPYEARIPPGTILETAGLGGVFPPGIRVGRVLAEADSRSGWSHSYLVEPAVRPGAIRAATVWSRPAAIPSEPDLPASGQTSEAQRQAEDPGDGR